MSGLIKSQVAASLPFDPTGSILTSTLTEGAIKEVASITASNTRAYTFAVYNANAGAGRYLEFFNGIASNTAPFFSPTSLKLLLVVTGTTAANATCTIGFYDLQSGSPVLLYTQTITGVKRKTDTGSYASPLASIPANCLLAVKVDSGSINSPHMYFAIQG